MSLPTLLSKRGRAIRRLKRLTPDQLRREHVRLDQILQQTQRELYERENYKAALFERGRQTDSEAERISLARGMQRLDAAVKHMQRRMELIHRHMHVLDGLSALQTTRGLLESLGIGSVLAEVSAEDLGKLLEDAAVEGTFETEKLDRLARLIDGADDIAEAANGVSGDANLQEIVRAMEQARAVSFDRAASKQPAETARGLREAP
ncbi:MAG TPA: hypothetical protein VG326_04300 [Tepidisphaeraceae bacterium]|jgi:hypothetical protein|nr:hypothetical protein [Tepidisphaeraceae bacterium]